MTTVAKGRGLMSFLKTPGNPAAFMLAQYSLRLAAAISLTSAAPDATPKTTPTAAALAVVVQTAKNRMNSQMVLKIWRLERSFLART